MKTPFLIFLILIVSCNSQKKIEYEFPAAMLPHVKTEFQKRCEQGRVLYSMNCARCHNTKVKRKEVIPEFDEQALRGYKLRISNAEHENNMPDSVISEEQLSLIMTFLTYRKRPVLPK